MIVASGLFLGYVFPDILINHGLEEEKGYGYVSVLALAVMPLVAYATRVFWISGRPAFNGLKGFVGSVFPWLSITLLIGGAIRLVQRKMK